MISQYAKAVVGALVAGLTALGTALLDEAVTPAEWVAVAVAALTALGVVWAVPNAPKT
jgi:EamA domain-containing membrane protein RarD